MKICTVCKILLPLTSFGVQNKAIDKLTCRCKECSKTSDKERRQSITGLITAIYGRQVASSKKRNHSLPTYSKQELSSFLLSSSIFLDLYNKWKESGFKTDLSPSMDRLDDYKGYSFDNVQIVTWKENNTKHYKDRKDGKNNKHSNAVNQYSLLNEYIQSFYSVSEAARQLGINKSTISKCILGKYNHAGGFLWKLQK